MLQINTTLKSLNLTGNNISHVGARALATVLKVPEVPERTAAIEALNLYGNPIGDAGAQSIAQMLEVNFRIKSLNLGNTGITAEGIISICSVLSQQKSSKVEELSLERPLLYGPQETVIMHISNMLAVNSTIKLLNLSKFGMVDSELETIVTYGLLRNNSVSKLQISSNQLSGFSGMNHNYHVKVVRSACRIKKLRISFS